MTINKEAFALLMQELENDTETREFFREFPCFAEPLLEYADLRGMSFTQVLALCPSNSTLPGFISHIQTVRQRIHEEWLPKIPQTVRDDSAARAHLIHTCLEMTMAPEELLREWQLHGERQGFDAFLAKLEERARECAQGSAIPLTDLISQWRQYDMTLSDFLQKTEMRLGGWREWGYDTR